jgi:hypothetical protein
MSARGTGRATKDVRIHGEYWRVSGRAAGIENLEMKTAKHENERRRAPGCGWVLDGLPKDDARLIGTGVIGEDGNPLGIRMPQQLHPEAFVKGDGA